MSTTYAQTRTNRNLTIYLSTLLLLLNLTTFLALHFLPSDPLHLAANASLYTLTSALLSLLGLLGATRNAATPVHIFANHLLLDALISTVPRLLLVYFAAAWPRDTCLVDDPILAHRCVAVLALGRGVGFLLVLGVAGAQWVCAWRVRVFAGACEVWECRAEEEGGSLMAAVGQGKMFV